MGSQKSKVNLNSFSGVKVKITLRSKRKRNKRSSNETTSFQCKALELIDGLNRSFFRSFCRDPSCNTTGFKETG